MSHRTSPSSESSDSFSYIYLLDMANFGTVRRQLATASSAFISPDEEPKDSTEENLECSFKFIWPFSIPSTPEAAAARIIRNLGCFALYYAQFMSLVLLITLIPERKVSLVYLVIMKEITLMYLLLLRALPNSFLLHKIIDTRVVLFLLILVTAVELILTRAAIHLLASLAGTIPIVLVHAVFWRIENPFENRRDSAAEELMQLVDNENGDADAKQLDSV